MSTFIEEALAKARLLAKQAKSRSAANGSNDGGGGLAGALQARDMAGCAGNTPPPGTVTPGPPINHTAPHMKAQAEGRRLFIGGLSYDTTDQSLEAYLSSKWPTEEAKVKRDSEGKSRGFAFVAFPVQSILEDCFNAQPHWIDGKQVEMRKVSPDGSSGNNQSTKRSSSAMTSYGGGGGGTSTRVFIGQAPGGSSKGLTDDVQDDDLRKYFERYGTVTGIAQHRWEDTGRKKGFGYMEFGEYCAAESALGIHTVCGVHLEVKPYTQGGTRTGAPPPCVAAPPRPPPTYNSAGVSSDYGYGSSGPGYGYGYGSDNKRSRTDLPPQEPTPTSPSEMMEQMKAMMAQMQQMQQQMSGGGTDQLQDMQKTMYSMMHNQYMNASQNSSPAPPTPPAPPAPPYQGSSSTTAYSGSGSGSSYSNCDSAYPGYPTSTPNSYQYPTTIEYPKPPTNSRY